MNVPVACLRDCGEGPSQKPRCQGQNGFTRAPPIPPRLCVIQARRWRSRFVTTPCARRAPRSSTAPPPSWVARSAASAASAAAARLPPRAPWTRTPATPLSSTARIRMGRSTTRRCERMRGRILIVYLPLAPYFCLCLYPFAFALTLPFALIDPNPNPNPKSRTALAGAQEEDLQEWLRQPGSRLAAGLHARRGVRTRRILLTLRQDAPYSHRPAGVNVPVHGPSSAESMGPV